MRSIHTTNQQDHKNNTPYRVIHQHRTKLGNPIRGIIVPTSIIPITTITLLSLFSVSLANIIGSSTTYAEGSSVSLSVDNSDTVLELTVPSSVSLDLTPSSTNNYNPSGTASLSVSAGTNNLTGYTLTMSVPSTNLVNSSVTLSSSNNPNHIPLDNSNHPIIPTITSTYSGSNFPDNAWGYRIGNTTNYSPVSSNISLPGTNSAGNATTTTIEFAAKVNSAQPAGAYTTTLSFTVVANVPPQTISSITNMQDMTPEICSASEKNETAQLKDTRDNKLYWVTRLADDNCWMTQNLDYELSTSVTLTPTDSDVSSAWAPNINTQNSQYDELGYTAQWMRSGGYLNNDYSYRPASDKNAGTSIEVSYGPEIYKMSSPVFMKDGITMQPWKTTSDCVNAGNSSELCAHWNVGTFYSYRAATAGSGAEVFDKYDDASDSICPKGWKLPKDSDFQTLITTAGLTASNAVNNPFYFLRSGYYDGYDEGGGSINTYDVGSIGEYLSSTFYYDMSGNLDLGSNSIDQGMKWPYDGLSVRCIAK